MLRSAFLLLALWAPFRVIAADGHTRATLHVETPAVAPGQTFWAAVRLHMDPGWHTYWKDPGESGLATKIQWQLPAGFTAGDIHWPRPEVITTPPITDYGYHGEAVLLVPLTAPALIPTATVRLAARVDWLECKDICVPGKADLAVELPVSQTVVAADPETARFFDRARAQLPAPGEDPYAFAQKPKSISLAWALVFAFLGGLLLNLMPCVLPVLSIKVLGFLNETGSGGKRNAWLYAVGVVVSFWVLAAALLGLRAAGQPLGWGFQLQSPMFVTVLILLFFVLGLNLLGLFEVGTSLIGLASLAGKNGGLAAFSSGALAVLVATPCTAPLMGPAIGFAVIQPPMQSLAVFTALGMGLAVPYVALAHFPRALRWIPKPGVWMLTLKQFMAFLFFATCLWLLWVLGLQRGVGGLIRVLIGLWVLGVGAWVYGPLRATARESRRGFLTGAAVVLLVLGLMAAFPQRSNNKTTWEPYSEVRLTEARAQGKPVFVDFTAAWCLTCQVNERTTLSSRSVQQAFRDNNVTLFKADWTDRDPMITAALERHGRSGVPLYVYYPGREAAPVLLPTLLKPQDVIDAIQGEKQ